MPENVQQLTDHLFRHEAGRMVAVLTRIFGFHNFELVEDVVQEAFGKALKDWTYQIPANPSAWLMQTAKNKAIDIVRRQRYQKEFAEENAQLLKSEYTASAVIENLFMDHEIEDSQLRLIFACCHPSLSEADQIALTLKTSSGFSLQEIASALLLNHEVVKKRLQRARYLIAEHDIKLNIPTGEELKNRLDMVLHTIYLIFNEGYHSSSKENLIRKDLCEEAIRLSLLLEKNRFTNQHKCYALIALLCLLASRFDARIDEEGEIVLLEDQDRNKWNHDLIAIGMNYFEKSMGGNELGEYHIEAAIVAEHSIAPNFSETNWTRILSLYDTLLILNPSPVVMLNRAIVLSKVDSIENAIEAIHQIPDFEKLVETHYLFPSTLGEMYRQLGQFDKAKYFLKMAIEIAQSPLEQKLLTKKLSKLN